MEGDMQFVDSSAETSRRLDRIGSVAGHPSGRHLNVGIVGDDGIELIAGNLGLPWRQVALGFTGGAHDEGAQFRDVVIRRLEQQWSLRQVPKGQGASANIGCV